MNREQRGRIIYKTKNQIRRTNDQTYEVCSQTTPYTKYTLVRTAAGWDCSCPDTTPYCKHAYAVEHRLGMKARADRGMIIHERGGQVECIAPDHYLVHSQSHDNDVPYEVRDFGNGWMCSCPDHLHTGARCKHIQAVQWSSGERSLIVQPDQTVCRYCDSPNIIRKGTQAGHHKFRCRTCGKYFVDNLGFEGARSIPEHITLTVEMVYGGMSTRKVANALAKIDCTVTHQTVLNWCRRFGDLMDTFLYYVTPHVGEEWRTDEVYLSIRGERKYLFAMLDSETRYWIARMVATHKGTDDVRPTFQKAKDVAGVVPSKLISDGASNFAEAHHTEYAPRNFLWKNSVHESHIRMDGDTNNNNQMESFNGNTIRLREKVVRGLKNEDAALLAGLQVYHNHVRPHLGLSENQTPGEAAVYA